MSYICILIAQACAKLLSLSWGAVFFPSILARGFLHKVHVQHFDRTGWHRVVVAHLERGIFLVHSCINGFCEISICISIAQARAKCAPQGSQALDLRHFLVKFLRERALAEILQNSYLRGPCMILFMS